MARISPYVACSLVLFMLVSGSSTLRCYNCFNLDVKDDTTDRAKTFISTITGGKTKSDPKCGTSPSSSNTMICGNEEVCGAITSDISAQVPIVGKVHVGAQVRTCIQASAGPLGSCEKTDNTVKTIIEEALSFATALSTEFNVDGKICACNTDLCTPDVCEGGVSINSFCVQNWIIGVSVAAAVVVLILFISCCCCCCGCCKRSAPVMVLPPATPYGMQTTTVMSSSQSQSAQGYGYPVQSYSPGYSGSSTGQNDFNPVGYSNGPPNYKDPTNAGYNQAV
jgi:hypothetical protein